MAAVSTIVGESVINKDNVKVDINEILGEGKFIGLYFSAHWCPPCRNFTPELVSWYSDFKKTDRGSSFDLIFVSSDRDEKSFDEYYAEMPWLALEFSNRDAKNKLSKLFKVNGIPTLVILDGATGALITDQGRRHVSEDPVGELFPWRPKSLEQIFFSGDFIKNDKTEVKRDEMKAVKVKGIYFSAHWCPPCRGFTPALVETYKKVKAAGNSFEIIFCSADRDEASFQTYFNEMPWLAVPYGDPRIEELNTTLEIEGIPALVIFDENNKIITFNGRSEVGSDPEGVNFPWRPQAVNALTAASAEKLNENPSVILFTDGSSASIEQAKIALKDSAERYFTKGDDQDLYFFYAGKDEIVESVCNFSKLSVDQRPLLVILDVQEMKRYEAPSSADFSSEAVSDFVRAFEAGSLQPKDIRS